MNQHYFSFAFFLLFAPLLTVNAQEDTKPKFVQPANCMSGQVMDAKMQGEVLAFGARGAARLAFGMTKIEVEKECLSSRVKIDKAAPNQWRIGYDVFIFVDEKLARMRNCF